MTQTALIEAALKAGERLTPLDALRRFGCFRLGARIWDLRQAGLRIERQIIAVETAAGDTAHVAEYRLAA